MDNGWVTNFVGKYLNGYGTSVKEDLILPGWADWKALVDPKTYKVFNFRINENGNLVDYSNGEHQTKVLSNLASEFLISTSPAQPFYLDVNTLAPHIELEQIAFPDCKIQNPQAWGRFIRPEPDLRSKYSETIAFLERAPLFPQAIFVGIRTDDEMFAEVGSNLEDELYDLIVDPLELENKVSKNPQRTSELRNVAYSLANVQVKIALS